MKSTIAILAVLLGVATAGLVGGWHDMSANSKEAQRATAIAELRVNEMSNSVFHKKTTRVISVRSKVVAGILYEVVLEVGQTGCPKGSDVANCVVAEVKILNMSLFPWKRASLQTKFFVYHHYVSSIDGMSNNYLFNSIFNGKIFSRWLLDSSCVIQERLLKCYFHFYFIFHLHSIDIKNHL